MIVPVDARLRRHLRRWLGRWPATETLTVVGSRQRQRPAWDGRVFPVIGVRSPESTVLSVPPARAPVVRDVARRADWSDLLARLPALVDRPHQRVYSGVFRFCLEPAPLSDAGVWVDASKPSVPEWLRPFGHEVLIAWDVDTGAYLAGVGIKHHDRYGHELAVGTEPAARGQGLARRLVAQAARRIIDEGGVPTYQHDPANVASAKVAEAAGFPDRGWRSVGLG